MNENVCISIIISIYNTERYLSKCIDSVLSQTFTDFELLLIDDGSTDNSGRICDEYAEKDKRIRVFHKRNEGVSLARKLGFVNALGEWICFMDSDDVIPENSLNILIENSQKYDIVVGTLKTITENNQIKDQNNKYNQIEYDKDAYMCKLLERRVPISLCAHLYRKNILTEEIFDVPTYITNFEDYFVNIKIAICASIIKYIDVTVYYYIMHKKSASHNFVLTLDYLNSFENEILKILTNKNLMSNYKYNFLIHKIDMLRFAFDSDKNFNINNNLIKNVILESKQFNIRRKEKIILFCFKHKLIGKLLFNCYLILNKYL